MRMPHGCTLVPITIFSPSVFSLMAMEVPSMSLSSWMAFSSSDRTAKPAGEERRDMPILGEEGREIRPAEGGACKVSL